MLAPKDPDDYKQWQLANLSRSIANAPVEHLAVSLNLIATELGMRERVAPAIAGTFGGSSRSAPGEFATVREAGCIARSGDW